MAKKLTFVNEVPGARSGRKSYFDEEIVEQLTKNSGKWAKVDTSAASAKAFVTENPEFAYKTRTTDKTRTNRNGKEVPVVEVYVAHVGKAKKK